MNKIKLDMHLGAVNEKFEEWFQSLLLTAMAAGDPSNHPLGACWQRDVLRDSKAELRKSFIKIRYGRWVDSE